MFLPYNGLYLWACASLGVVIAQSNESNQVFGDNQSIDLTVARLAPVSKNGFTFQGTYDTGTQWDSTATTARYLLDDAYFIDFGDKPVDQHVEPGSRYNSYHGAQREFVVTLEFLYSQGVQPTWLEAQDALEILKDDIMPNQWSLIGRSMCLMAITYNNAPLMSIRITRARGAQVQLKSAGALTVKGTIYYDRKINFPNAEACLLQEIHNLTDEEARRGPFTIEDGAAYNRNEGLVHMALYYKSWERRWPSFTGRDMIYLLQAMLSFIRVNGRSNGFGFYIYHGNAPNQIKIGQFYMHQEYIPAMQELRNGSAIAENVTNIDPGDPGSLTATPFTNNTGRYGDQGNGMGNIVDIS